MITERVMDLWRDQKLQDFLHEQCENKSRDEELQADLFASVWAWISCNAPDQMDVDTIREYAIEAIDYAYRKELAERQLIHELIALAEIEEQDVRVGSCLERRSDAGTIISGGWRY